MLKWGFSVKDVLTLKQVSKIRDNPPLQCVSFSGVIGEIVEKHTYAHSILHAGELCLIHGDGRWDLPA